MGSKSSSQTIGYRYFMTMQMGLGRGPIDEVVQIQIGDKNAWPVAEGVSGVGAPTSDGNAVIRQSPQFAATSAGSSSLSDSTKTWNINQWVGANIVIISGTGAGQTRSIISNSATQYTTSPDWTIQPDNTSVYVISGVFQEFPIWRSASVYEPFPVTLTDTGSTKIDAYNLFGGDRSEGGVSGTLELYNGHPNQNLPGWLKTLIGGNVSDMRGVVTLLFNGMLCALNPYPKTWNVRTRRILKGWDGEVWHPELAPIVLSDGAIVAMNPIHILYECVTNRDWGGSFPRSRIDEVSWLEAAQTCFDEGFGLCLKWNRQDLLQAFVQNVLDHVGGTMYTDRSTGLISIKLFRNDYVEEDLPLFTYETGLLAIEPEVAVRAGAVNEIVVKYRDPIKNEDRMVRAQNLAAIQTSDSRITNTIDYSGAPTLSIAGRLAERDLKVSTSATKRYNITLDRRAWRIYPGAAFRVSAPDKNVQNVIVRAGKIEDNRGGDGKIKISAVIDVFGLESASFVSSESSTWVPPNKQPLIVVNRYLREATYHDLVTRLTPLELGELQVSDTLVATMAARPSALAIGYNILSRTGTDAFLDRGFENWAPLIILSAPVSHYATTISFVTSFDLAEIEIGALLQLGDEIVRIDSIGSGFLNISRGCLDTVPSVHEIGTKAFAYVDRTGVDRREYVSFETVNVKLQTVTTSAELDAELIPTDNIYVIGRQARPYPPANVTIGAVLAFNVSSVTGDLVLNWVHRDRIIQQDQIIQHMDATIGPESGTTYQVRILSSSDVLLHDVSGIVGTTFTLSGEPSIVGTIKVELSSWRSGLQSFQKYLFTLTRTI